MSNNNPSIDHDPLITYLYHDIDNLLPWFQRKEIAAWSAILFYIAILGTYMKLIFEFIDKTKSIEFLPLSISALFFSICFLTLLSYIFFRFIHSQYSSIYQWHANTAALKSIILETIEAGSRPEMSKVKEQIEKDTKKLRKEWYQIYIGNYHPLIILFFFWIELISLPFRNKGNSIVQGFLKEHFNKLYDLSYKRCEETKRYQEIKSYLSNFERQEAALYSLLLLIALTAFIAFNILFYSNIVVQVN